MNLQSKNYKRSILEDQTNAHNDLTFSGFIHVFCEKWNHHKQTPSQNTYAHIHAVSISIQGMDSTEFNSNRFVA